MKTKFVAKFEPGDFVRYQQDENSPALYGIVLKTDRDQSWKEAEPDLILVHWNYGEPGWCRDIRLRLVAKS